MKKYLTIVVVLGALAVLGTAYFAQANEQAAAPAAAGAAMAPAADAAMAPAADAASTFATDKAECESLAATASTEGAAPSDADKAAAVTKCLEGNGHSAEEITKQSAPAVAPAAPAAPAEAPAAK
jgi:hypothetical protein